MANNTRKSMSNKYWENETPIVTETEKAEVHYFKEAGKIQLYPTYVDKDGETKLGRGCTWDNNEMTADDAVRLAFALMQGLLDCGVENEAYNDAYNILKDEMENLGENVDDEEEDDELDGFEDEVNPYDVIVDLDRSDAVKVAKELGVKVLKKDTVEAIADKISENHDDDEVIEVLETLGLLDTESDDDEEEETDGFSGKNIIYVDGNVKLTSKKVSEDYKAWAEDAIEWATYIEENTKEISSMPTKTAKQKKAQDAKYKEFTSEVNDWISEWEDSKTMKTVRGIVDEIIHEQVTVDDAIVSLLELIDKMKF